MERGDFTRVAHIGMSFGGSTAAALGYEDPRCVAAVNLDGGDYHRRSANRPSPVPLLVFHSDWRYLAEELGDESAVDLDFGFNDFSYESYADAGQTEDVYRLRVKNVKHIGISDYPLMLREPLSSMLVGSIDSELMMEIINDFVLGFLDRHLRGIGNNFPNRQFAEHADDVVPHDASKVRSWWQTKTRVETQKLEKDLDEALAM
jgi:predicted dienelactone hydrolase